MEVMLALPAIDLQAKGEAMKCAARLKLERNWRDTRGYIDDKSHRILVEKELGQIPEVNMPTDRIIQACMVEKRYEVVIQGKEEASEKAKAVTGQKTIHVFTDGSRQDGKTGAGYIIRLNTHDIMWSTPLGTNATVNQAELYAISEGARKLLDQMPKVEEINFFSDSQVCLKGLEADETRSSLVLECHRLLQRLATRYKVTINWVPGHAGIAGNEEADQKAKEGSGMTWEGPEPALPIPWDKIRKKINDRTKSRSIKRFLEATGYRESKEHIRMNLVDKDLETIVNLSRQELKNVVAVVTGHSNLRAHLYRMKIVTDDRCQKCKGETETANHFVATCPAYVRHRMIALGTPVLPDDFWKNIPYKKLARFIGKTGRLSEKSEN
jgi:ribonuclease HI